MDLPDNPLRICWRKLKNPGDTTAGSPVIVDIRKSNITGSEILDGGFFYLIMTFGKLIPSSFFQYLPRNPHVSILSFVPDCKLHRDIPTAIQGTKANALPATKVTSKFLRAAGPVPSSQSTNLCGLKMILKSTVEFFFKPLKLSPNYGGLSRKIFLLHRPLSQKNPNDQPIFEVSSSISGCIPVLDCCSLHHPFSIIKTFNLLWQKTPSFCLSNLVMYCSHIF